MLQMPFVSNMYKRLVNIHYTLTIWPVLIYSKVRKRTKFSLRTTYGNLDYL